MISEYHKKMTYLLNKQNYKCAACFEPLGVDISFQHGLANSKMNRKAFPLFIDSLLNLYLLHLLCNTTKYRSYGRITFYRAEKKEAFLKKHSRCNKFVNEVV